MRIIQIIVLYCIYVIQATRQIYAENNDEVTSTTATLADHLVLEINAPVDASYFIEWTSEMHTHDTTQYTRVCLTLNDGDYVLNDQRCDPTPDDIGLTEAWAVATGFGRINVTAGVHHFKIKFASSGEGDTVKIRRSRIMAQEYRF